MTVTATQDTGGIERQPEITDLMTRVRQHAVAASAPRSTHPYHNWEHHVGPMFQAAQALGARCRRHGVHLDMQVLETAVLFHDALFHVEPDCLGFKSREHLAAAYAGKLLRRAGAPEDFAARVEETILATNVEFEPATPEEKAIRALDLTNIGGPYWSFLANTQLLCEEAKKQRGGNLSFTDFARGSIHFLGGYIARMVELTPEARDEQGRSTWHMAGVRNLVKLFQDIMTPGEDARVVLQVPVQSGAALLSPLRVLHDNDFLIGVSSGDLYAAHKEWNALRAERQSQAPGVFLPGTPDAIPVPDQMCDEVYLTAEPSPDVIREALRVMKTTGTLTVKTSAATEPVVIEVLQRMGMEVARAEEKIGSVIKAGYCH